MADIREHDDELGAAAGSAGNTNPSGAAGGYDPAGRGAGSDWPLTTSEKDEHPADGEP